MSAVVGTDVALEAAIVVSLEDLKNTRVAVAVAVAGLGEVAILKVLDVTHMSEGDPVAMLADDFCHVVKVLIFVATK